MFKFITILVIFYLKFSSVNAIENYHLINIDSINIIFNTDIKTWNQNVIFLDKKKSMKKVKLDNKISYSLKSIFNNGYLILTPSFRNNEVILLNLNYNFNKYTESSLNRISNYFDNLKKYCSIIKYKNNDIFIDLYKC